MDTIEKILKEINKTAGTLGDLARRVRRLETMEKGGGGGIAAVIEGPGIDVVGGDQVGLGGDSVLIFDDGGNPVAEYAATDAGLTAALAAATSGQFVGLSGIPITGAGYTVGSGVTLMGLSIATNIHATITLEGGTLYNLRVTPQYATAVTGYAIISNAPIGEKSYIYNCFLFPERTAPLETTYPTLYVIQMLGAGELWVYDSQMLIEYNKWDIGYIAKMESGCGDIHILGNRAKGNSNRDFYGEYMISGARY